MSVARNRGGYAVRATAARQITRATRGHGSQKRYTDEQKLNAIKLVIEGHFEIRDVRVKFPSIGKWVSKYTKDHPELNWTN
jgi:hypothetical protein